MRSRRSRLPFAATTAFLALVGSLTVARADAVSGLTYVTSVRAHDVGGGSISFENGVGCTGTEINKILRVNADPGYRRVLSVATSAQLGRRLVRVVHSGTARGRYCDVISIELQ